MTGSDLFDLLKFFVPLGIVGLWRWGAWAGKKIVSAFYRPVRGEFSAPVSAVTPVYNEDPQVFRAALDSWKANGPSEIIAVIDSTDKNCIQVFEEFRRGFPTARMIITETPGKREALAEGIKASTAEIIALVDSDTVWSPTLLRDALPPFANQRVGGVGTRQVVLKPTTIAQRIFDIQLDLRYHDDMMPSGAAGAAFSCLSGRTAIYRRAALLPFLEDLVNETFWGKKCVGGDDKRLTYLIERAGWEARYQHHAVVYTRGFRDVKTLFKQRIRWSRNSWRADLRALWQGWVWKHPFLAFLLVDRAISNFTLLVSFSFFAVSIALGLWVPAALLAAWWLFSRGIRLLPNLTRSPSNIWMVPIYIPVNFAQAILRIYALLSMNQQGWLTRGAKKRRTGISLWLAGMGTFAIVFFMAWLVYQSRP